jgi:hypothetical protein
LALIVCMLSRRFRALSPEPITVVVVVQSAAVGISGLARRTSALLGVRLGLDPVDIPAAFRMS